MVRVFRVQRRVRGNSGGGRLGRARQCKNSPRGAHLALAWCERGEAKNVPKTGFSRGFSREKAVFRSFWRVFARLARSGAAAGRRDAQIRAISGPMSGRSALEEAECSRTRLYATWALWPERSEPR